MFRLRRGSPSKGDILLAGLVLPAAHDAAPVCPVRSASCARVNSDTQPGQARRLRAPGA